MMKIVFDSFAIIALFREEPGHKTVSDLLTAISLNEMHGFMSVVNVGEVYYMTSRKQGNKEANLALESLMKFPIEFITADLPMTLEAARLKAKYKFSYADAFAAALTIAHRATLITGDNEFKELVGEPNFKVRLI